MLAKGGFGRHQRQLRALVRTQTGRLEQSHRGWCEMRELFSACTSHSCDRHTEDLRSVRTGREKAGRGLHCPSPHRSCSTWIILLCSLSIYSHSPCSNVCVCFPECALQSQMTDSSCHLGVWIFHYRQRNVRDKAQVMCLCVAVFIQVMIYHISIHGKWHTVKCLIKDMQVCPINNIVVVVIYPSI